MAKARAIVYIEPVVMHDSPELARKLARYELTKKLEDLGCTSISPTMREHGLADIAPEGESPHFVFVFDATGRK